ncbi:protein kinase domain protein, partial [Ichthyophthirius multifiliis]
MQKNNKYYNTIMCPNKQKKLNDNKKNKKQAKRVKQTVKLTKTKNNEGNKMINNYILIGNLGQGAYGKVALAVKKINENEEQKFAIKIFKKSFLKKKREYYRDSTGVMKFKDALDNVKREIAIMKKLRHLNVIKLYEVIENPDNDKLYMVLEFAQGGQIIEWDDDDKKFFFCNQKQNEPLSEDYLRNIFRGCIKGLFYLHSSGIVHRDIKPQNILLDKYGNPKMADFGVSAISDKGDNLQGNEGTYFFMPPEALNKESAKKGYSGKKADIWALGVTFFSFAFLQLPFYGNNLLEIFQTIIDQQLEFPTHRQCSDGLKNFLLLMIEKSPEKRSTLIEISKSEWINQNQQDDLSTQLQNIIIIKYIKKKRIENKIVEVNDEDLDNALQISTVIRIKAWVQRWKANTNARNSNDRSIDSKSVGYINKANSIDNQCSQELKNDLKVGGISKFGLKSQSNQINLQQEDEDQ